MFFCHAFSETPQPIALKLCHMIRIWLYFINWLQKFGGRSPQKNWGPKTCKISVNFGPLPTLTANISGTRQRIQNRKDVRTSKIPPAFDEKSPEFLQCPPPKICDSQKIAQDFSRFFTTFDFDREYLRNESTHQKSEKLLIIYNPSHVKPRKFGVLWSTNEKVIDSNKCTP